MLFRFVWCQSWGYRGEQSAEGGQGFCDFLSNEYLPACPVSRSLTRWRNGKEVYRELARRYTTTDLDPKEIHKFGINEVVRIRAAMLPIIARTGYKGSLDEFLSPILRGLGFLATDLLHTDELCSLFVLSWAGFFMVAAIRLLTWACPRCVSAFCKRAVPQSTCRSLPSMWTSQIFGFIGTIPVRWSQELHLPLEISSPDRPLSAVSHLVR